jgi:hypothetical protein
MRVIATASSPDAIALCQQLGADHVINYKTEDVAARVKEITGGACGAPFDRVWRPDAVHAGAGADIVLDNVGAPTIESSIRSAAPRGHVCMIAGGSVDKFGWDPMSLRSITVHYVFKDSTVLAPDHPATLLQMDGDALAQAVALYEQGKLKVRVIVHDQQNNADACSDPCQCQVSVQRRGPAGGAQRARERSHHRQDRDHARLIRVQEYLMPLPTLFPYHNKNRRYKLESRYGSGEKPGCYVPAPPTARTCQSAPHRPCRAPPHRAR